MRKLIAGMIPVGGFFVGVYLENHGGPNWFSIALFVVCMVPAYLVGQSVDEAPKVPDVPWKPTGYSYRYTGHDESKATVSMQRSKDHDERRRKLALARGGHKSASHREFPRGVVK